MGLWNWFSRAGPSGFGAGSTAEEVTEGIDASHLTAIVTGSTSGIGKETARVLALRGAKVIIPARSLESGIKVKESLLKQNPDAKLQVMEMDVSSLESVRSFAQSFNSSNKHWLISNLSVSWFTLLAVHFKFVGNVLRKACIMLANPIQLFDGKERYSHFTIN